MDAAPTTGRPETAAQGDPDAVDDLCDPAGVVAFRAGHLLHARRLHPYRTSSSKWTIFSGRIPVVQRQVILTAQSARR